MDHIVADMQIGKALYLLSFIDSAFFLLFLFPAKNITFRNDDALQIRVLIALFDFSIGNHDLARFYFMLLVLCIKCTDPFFCDILCQTIRSGS